MKLAYLILALFGDKAYNLYLRLLYSVKFLFSDREAKELIRENRKFKNIHSGERCFIIGNGPSLKQQDLSLLENEYVFSVNQAMRNSQYTKIRSDYYFFADPVFFRLDAQKPEDAELIELMRKINSSDHQPQCFFPLDAGNFLKNNGLDRTLKINYFCSKYIFHENYSKDIDYTKVVPGFDTVVQYAITMAIYMGFRKIYLLGCDMTGYEIIRLRATQQDHDNDYSYKLTENEKKRQINMGKQFSAESTLLGYAKMFTGYRKLRAYCEKRNIQLINATAGGVLDNLPRAKYEDILKNTNVDGQKK